MFTLKGKIKDLEKKTELQALKYEEIQLELESIRAKRERLQPVCPHCNTQTIQLYHTHQQHLQLQNYQTLHKISHNVAVQTIIQFDATLNGEHPESYDAKNQIIKNLKLIDAKQKFENKETNTDNYSTKNESTSVNILKQDLKEKEDKVIANK